MIAGSLARRYARALMGLGIEEGNYERMGRELRNLAGAMKTSDELLEALTNPAFPRADREKVLSALLMRAGASQTLKNFTMLLLDRERTAILPGVSRELDAMIDEKAGRVKAEVTTAEALTPMEEKQLLETLETLSKKKVLLEKKEDPALLGGVVAVVGDLVYDGSLRTQLETLHRKIVK